MIAAIVATIIAGESNNSWDDRWVWQVVAAIAVGYMVSRGLAKSAPLTRASSGTRTVGVRGSGPSWAGPTRVML